MPIDALISSASSRPYRHQCMALQSSVAYLIWSCGSWFEKTYMRCVVVLPRGQRYSLYCVSPRARRTHWSVMHANEQEDEFALVIIAFSRHSHFRLTRCILFVLPREKHVDPSRPACRHEEGPLILLSTYRRILTAWWRRGCRQYWDKRLEQTRLECRTSRTDWRGGGYPPQVSVYARLSPLSVYLLIAERIILQLHQSQPWLGIWHGRTLRTLFTLGGAQIFQV